MSLRRVVKIVNHKSITKGIFKEATQLEKGSILMGWDRLTHGVDGFGIEKTFDYDFITIHLHNIFILQRIHHFLY